MTKKLDLKLSLAEIVRQYPELKKPLADLGFKGVSNPLLLRTVGEKTTIPEGAKKMNIPLDKVIKTIESEGFEVDDGSAEERSKLIENYLLRLDSGEDLDSVRADFVKDFDKVSAEDIIAAEQNLLNSGVPPERVKNLCDIHSALFHGMTDGEIDSENSIPLMKPVDMVPKGHPITALRAENNAIGRKLKSIDPDSRNLLSQLSELKDIRKHYGKKAGLIYPFLSIHGITGPSSVMWSVDDEILNELSILARTSPDALDDNIKERTRKVVQRAQEMVYKEENILYDFAIKNFTTEEWYRIYRDLPAYGWAFIEPPEKWNEAENWLSEQDILSEKISDGTVHLPTGDLTIAEIRRVFDILPVQITFIDENEKILYFSDNQTVFSRPRSALGRDVYLCHPAEVIPQVKQLVADFKAKKKDRLEVWIPRPADPVRTLYLPVWDNDRYLGTIEIVQQFGAVKDRLLEIWKKP